MPYYRHAELTESESRHLALPAFPLAGRGAQLGQYHRVLSSSWSRRRRRRRWATARITRTRANKRLSFFSYAYLPVVPRSTRLLSALASPDSLPLRSFGFGAAGEEDRTTDDVGSEWKREGKDLEERLEALQGFGG
ncbi:hypothetical protein B0H10DRAFT_2212033 [Mycena sp. CBHHK59/15]|nr:hypothetical protein B0H10DRAFT_2212033 [Mycena sp. CBHHK59/15]